MGIRDGIGLPAYEQTPSMTAGSGSRALHDEFRSTQREVMSNSLLIENAKARKQYFAVELKQLEQLQMYVFAND